MKFIFTAIIICLFISCSSTKKEKVKTVKIPEYIKIFRNHKNIFAKRTQNKALKKETLTITDQQILYTGHGIYNGQEDYYFNSPVTDFKYSKKGPNTYQVEFSVSPGSVYSDFFDVSNKTGIRMLPQGKVDDKRMLTGWMTISKLHNKEFLIIDLICNNNCTKNHYRFESLK